jgi:3-hydroxybutyryl-CoA dehydrogenase
MLGPMEAMDAGKFASAAVLGAGTMGHGIAQVCAQAGLQVRLFDVAPAALERGLKGIDDFLAKGVAKGKLSSEDAAATRARVSGATALGAACAGADVVIEAAPERLELKRSLFVEAAAAAPAGALLASNTSSLAIGAIAAGVPAPERLVGMHFFNPVPLMSLLEVVRGPASSQAAVDAAVALGRRLGKEPIVVRDAPGFASSRLGVAIGLEAIRMVEEGVASAADIDKAMELGYRHPMGPLRLTDLVGLDVRLGIAEYLARELGPRFEPPRLLREMVAAGKLGKKSGAGFYRWE